MAQKLPTRGAQTAEDALDYEVSDLSISELEFYFHEQNFDEAAYTRKEWEQEKKIAVRNFRKHYSKMHTRWDKYLDAMNKLTNDLNSRGY